MYVLGETQSSTEYSLKKKSSLVNNLENKLEITTIRGWCYVIMFVCKPFHLLLIMRGRRLCVQYHNSAPPVIFAVVLVVLCRLTPKLYIHKMPASLIEVHTTACHLIAIQGSLSAL